MRKANRILNVPPYLFAEIDKVRATVTSKGVPVIDLGVGDPDRPTPKRILDKFHKAVDDPRNHNYPPYEGTYDFRCAVAKWYKKRFGVILDPDTEVLSLIGSKEGIAHIFYAFIDPGDVALLPDPGYPVYNVGTIFAGGTPYSMPLLKENSFLPDIKSIEGNIVKKAKLLFINYPNNPTGAVAGREFLKEAVAFCRDNDLLLCSDLAYSEVAFDGYRPMSALEIPGAKDVTIEFHSLSKTYNMTGWRIGMAVGSAKAISALSIIKTNTDSGIFKAIQIAGIEALGGPQKEIDEMNRTYEERRDILIDGLNSLGWKLETPKATFYVWAPVPKGNSSASFVKFLLEKAGVLVVPGSGYGKYGEGYFRASITTDKKNITEAVKRMRKEGISFR
jgi:LL-diaminopimelate aminotransferase